MVIRVISKSDMYHNSCYIFNLFAFYILQGIALLSASSSCSYFNVFFLLKIVTGVKDLTIQETPNMTGSKIGLHSHCFMNTLIF